MRLPFSREGLIRVLCVVALAGTIYKGLLRTPEGASNLMPDKFYSNLINEGISAVINNERNRDFNDAMEKALATRLEEVHAGIYVPPAGSQITEESLTRALRTTRARTERVEDSVERANEQLARAKRLKATQWRMGLLTCSGVGEQP